MIGLIKPVDSKAGALQVLLALIVSGELGFSQLCRQIRLDRGTVRRAVERLVTIGIVERSGRATFPFEKRVRLTPFGRRVASAPLIDWPALFFEQCLLPTAGLRTESEGAPSKSAHGRIRVNLLGIPAEIQSQGRRGVLPPGRIKREGPRPSRKDPP